MLQLQCPACNASLSAPEDCAGRLTRCQQCGQPITVPTLSHLSTPPPVREKTGLGRLISHVPTGLQSTSRRAEDQVGFDPYHRWLGISPGQRPPTHYQLLGISPEEEDLEVIHAAALRQSAYVRNFQSGPHADLAARVLSELAEARAALTDPARRKEYDARLPRQNADQARARPPASAPRPKQEPPS